MFGLSDDIIFVTSTLTTTININNQLVLYILINLIINQKQEVIMKASKFALVIAFVAFATMIFAQVERPDQNEPAPTQICVKISLEKASCSLALVRAMYQQIDQRTFLQNEQNSLYIANVTFRHVHYVIYGKYEQWVSFFLMDLNDAAAEAAL